MEGIQYLKDLSLKGKRVLLRVDFNVPLNEALEIADDTRIKQTLPTIHYIQEQGGIAVLISHLGDPGGRIEPGLSLARVAKHLSQLLGTAVQFAPDCIGAVAQELVRGLKPGDVALLENLRFHSGEESDSPSFSSELAKLGNVFVNDAFATAHRRHSSMVGVPSLFKQKAAGLLMQKEIEYYEKSLEDPRRPLLIVFGGSKISTKLDTILNIANKADKIIVGGAMACTFLAAQGIQVGRSLFERDYCMKVLELLGMLARRDCKVYLPVDFMVGPSPQAKGLARAVTSLEIPADQMALDIGPASCALFNEAIQNAETIVWNGPMGVFENEDYSKGTCSLIESLASAHGVTISGGGDTIAAINQMELGHKFDYISTGGSAFLYMLEGKSLPGFAALRS